MPRYYCRVCWNTKGWESPSGRTKHEGTNAGAKGFGQEEWLFRPDWILEGYHYAFLQPIENGRSKKWKGKSLDLLLWSYSPSREWCEVGQISNCSVVSREKEAEVLGKYEKNGWLQQMREGVSAVGGRNGNDHWHFNVRFRVDDVKLKDPLLPLTRRPATARCQLVLVAE